MLALLIFQLYKTCSCIQLWPSTSLWDSNKV